MAFTGRVAGGFVQLLFVRERYQEIEIDHDRDRHRERFQERGFEESCDSRLRLGDHIDEVSFETIAFASKPVTDKVEKHRYQFVYNEFLPRSNQKFKLLEIGLGCDMAYGPGASARIWPKLFPKAEIYFLELDGACVQKWKAELDALGITALVGSQSDVTVLKNTVIPAGPFDVIIDDGGHSDNEMLTSLFELIPGGALKPGGLYFVEDMVCNFESVGRYRDNKKSYDVPQYLLGNPMLAHVSDGKDVRPFMVFQMWIEQLASSYMVEQEGTFATKNFNFVACGSGNCFIRMLTEAQKKNTVRKWGR